MTTEPTPADTASTNVTEQSPSAPSTAITETPAVPPAPAPAPTTPVVPAAPPTWPFKADVAMLALLLVLSFLLGSFAAVNSDVWLNLAIGKRYSEGKFEFGVDPYSWATEAHGGRPAVYWVNHSWLYCWLTYHLYAIADGMGLIIAKALTFTAAIGFLARIGWKETSRWFTLSCLVMATLVVSHRTLLQPVVVSFLFVAITLFVLEYVGIFAAAPTGNPDRSSWLWALPPLFAIWANLDAWFILGPIILGLCWAGTGLARWNPDGNPVSGKMMGLVFGAGVLACLVNPHLHRVFQLPAELAYLLVSVPLPDFLLAAGRALHDLEPNSPLTASSFGKAYWYWGDATTAPGLGFHPAGLAVYPLLLLGLAAFTLVALVKPQPGSPRLQANRFLLWLVFGVLALASWRFIAFFALIAAPLTALTLSEFVHWQQTNNPASASRGERGINLARLISIPFMLLLLYLAWPGWLHGTGNMSELFSSRRRVAWEVRADDWQKGAAESLLELHSRGECHNVFNVAPEFGNFLPWFAPGVKYYTDTRLGLFAGEASRFDKARKALYDSSLPANHWQALFIERDVQQAAMANLLTTGRIGKWWLTDPGAQDSTGPAHWRQRFADRRTMVFSWAGQGKSWDPELAVDDFNRQAFGASVRRPPPHGIEPTAAPSMWTLYLEGTGPTPGERGEFDVQEAEYKLGANMRPFALKPSFAWYCLTLVDLQAIPGGGMTIAPAFAVLADQFAPRDMGLPALPILMVRTARIGLAKNPLDPGAQFTMLVANENLRAQEDYLAGYRYHPRFPNPSALRDVLRQTQLIAAGYNLTQLQPDNFEYQRSLADYYAKEELYDLALDHRLLAAKALENQLSTARNAPSPKDRDAILKEYHSRFVAPLEKSVLQRTKFFKDNFDKAPPLAKINGALAQEFPEITENQVVSTRLGLAKKALDLVLELDMKSLDDREELHFERLRLDLLRRMGRIDAVAAYLKRDDVRRTLPPALYANYQLMAGAALGDYDAMDEAIAEIEKGLREAVAKFQQDANAKRPFSAASVVVAGFQANSCPGLVGAVLLSLPSQGELNEAENRLKALHHELFNNMTLRGIVALEAGNTKHARAIFEQTLREAGTEHHFSDRYIARRYRDLLNQQLGK